jgi:hypothetical protein
MTGKQITELVNTIVDSKKFNECSKEFCNKIK